MVDLPMQGVRRRSRTIETVMIVFVCMFLIATVLLTACSEDDPAVPVPEPPPTREESLPPDAVKITPETDLVPPMLHAAGWDDPVPLPAPVSTAGVEDAPVVSAGGDMLLFVFTPDASAPAEVQLLDRVSGIWQTVRQGDEWSEPVRVDLGGNPSLDGSLCLQGDTLWFGSFRAGNYRDDGDIFTAVRQGAGWGEVENAGAWFNETENVGELWVTGPGDRMIFHRDAPGGQGGYDLWSAERTATGWSDPVNLGATINWEHDDGWPCLSPDGQELWYTREVSVNGRPGLAIVRATWDGAQWSAPEEIVSGWVGDPGVDAAGNLYFTHHYMDAENNTIETDIYVARRQ